jgi:hypothetical protein
MKYAFAGGQKATRSWLHSRVFNMCNKPHIWKEAKNEENNLFNNPAGNIYLRISAGGHNPAYG